MTNEDIRKISMEQSAIDLNFVLYEWSNEK